MERWRIPVLRAAARGLPEFRGKQRAFAAVPLGKGLTRVRLGNRWAELNLGDPFERLATLGLYEPALMRAIYADLRQGDCFCDCGANVGMISIPVAGHLGPAGKVYAFEPAELTYQRLVTNIELQEHPGQIEAYECAVGASPGKAELTVSTQQAWSTMSRSASKVGTDLGREISHIAEVPVVTLDDFFSDAGRRPPNVVKIDVEGWEEEVIRGARRFLAQARPRAVIIERNQLILSAMNRSWSAAESLMLDVGYAPSEDLGADVVFRPHSRLDGE